MAKRRRSKLMAIRVTPQQYDALVRRGYREYRRTGRRISASEQARIGIAMYLASEEQDSPPEEGDEEIREETEEKREEEPFA